MKDQSVLSMAVEIAFLFMRQVVLTAGAIIQQVTGFPVDPLHEAPVVMTPERKKPRWNFKKKRK